jgi:hypothetical protein
MASRKTTASKPQHCYIARAEDLKILGYVEAADEKAALKKAKKELGAASVELREETGAFADTPTVTATERASAEPTGKKGGKSKKAVVTDDEATVPSDKRPAKELTPRKLSAIDAAAKVVAEHGQPMNCQEMIDAMAAKGYWSSPKGLTPAATLYSSILREIAKKGADARFKKTERGKFAAR